MKKFVILAVLFIGCTNLTEPNYLCECEVKKSNGQIYQVDVRLFGYGEMGTSQTVNNRRDMDKLIDALENLVQDLKSARDQFPVVEPPIEKPANQ